MIESLQLRNFQNVRKGYFEFEKITTLIGPTDAGKSTILRALQWLMLNHFDGPPSEVINWDARSVSGTLSIDNRTVTRRKGKSNLYKLGDKTFSAIGTKVPGEIATLLNVSSINFQNQLDQHFWFSESASQVSRELNQIVNLGQIDEALSAIATQARRSRVEVEVCERRLKEAFARKQELAWVMTVDEALIVLERRSAKIAARATRMAALALLTEKAVRTRKKLQTARSEADRGSDVLKTGAFAVKTAEQAAKLWNLMESLQTARKLAKTPLTKVPSPETATELAKRREQLASLLEKFKQAKETRCQKQAEISILNNQLRKLNPSGTCPVCGKGLKV